MKESQELAYYYKLFIKILIKTNYIPTKTIIMIENKNLFTHN